MFDLDWYYVNLAERTDRDLHVRKEFQRHSIKATRFEAFTPDEWPGKPEQIEGMKRTPGAIGCYQSQMHLIRLAQGSERVVVVCEDDVIFCVDLGKRLQYISDNLTWDWDIFYLGATFHTGSNGWFSKPECLEWNYLGNDVALTSDPHILRCPGIWGTYAYLVNPKNAKKVCQLFAKNIYRARGIDHLAILLGPQLNTFCFVPGCASQYDNLSNIGGKGKRWTYFSNFNNLGPYVFTKYMKDFDPTTYDWNANA